MALCNWIKGVSCDKTIYQFCFTSQYSESIRGSDREYVCKRDFPDNAVVVKVFLYRHYVITRGLLQRVHYELGIFCLYKQTRGTGQSLCMEYCEVVTLSNL